MVDNNTRAAMLQTGEASFAFPVPLEQAKLLQGNSKLDVVTTPSIMQRYISLNVTQKPFDNPKVREALEYALILPRPIRQSNTIRPKRASC